MAQKEHSIKMTIDQAEADLDACIVKPISYQGTYLLAEIEVDIGVMEECLMKANSVSASIHAKRYRHQIDRLLKTLKTMIKFFNIWKAVQKLWAYMTPIFHGSDLAS